MRKTIYILLLCCVTLFSHAQHYVGFGATADVPLSLNDLPFTQMTLGVGGELCGRYAFQQGHFILQTGVDFGIQQPRLHTKDQELEQPMVDTRGVYFIYRGDLTSRIDVSRQIGIGVPIMLGFASDHFYVIAGARYYNIFSAQSNITAQLKTMGDYDGRYYDWFENMPNHGYHDYTPTKSSGKMRFGHDVQICAEIGGRIQLYNSSRLNHQPVLHIGAWVSYGLLNINNNKESTSSLVEPDYSQYMQVVMTHPYNSIEGSYAKVHNLCVGMKATVLFNLSGEETTQTKYRKQRKFKKVCRCLGVY